MLVPLPLKNSRTLQKKIWFWHDVSFKIWMNTKEIVSKELNTPVEYWKKHMNGV